MNPRTARTRYPVYALWTVFAGGLLALGAQTGGMMGVGVALSLLSLLFARSVFNLWSKAKATHLQMVRVLMSAVDAADPFTRDHAYRVSRMSLRIGRHLGMRTAALEELEFAALAHDIGRTAIQRDVLMKRGKLNADEMLLLKAHPRIGADLVAEQRFFPGAAEIIHAHHEQPDGLGYPRGLAGEAVPMGSRIIMVVAAFDAMTSDRPYRRGLTPEQACEELRAHSGTQFFPDVVEALIRLYADGTLFAEFDEAHLERYRDGHEHSRAVEAHLKGRADDLPVIELSIVERPPAEAAKATAATAASPAYRAEIPVKAKGDWRFVVAGQSDLGCERSNNEDSFGVFRPSDTSRGCLLVLADGMGGAAAGEVASRLTVDTVGEAFERGRKHGQARETLTHALGAANRAVHARAAADRTLAGMGTTCTAAALVGLDLTLGHVGDSRAYLVRGGTIEQLTQDHTLSGELARVAGGRGIAVPVHSNHVLTRCIGTQASLQVDVSATPLRLDDGAILVLCSDGLSNVVEDEEIRDLTRANDPAAACGALIDLARARGGPDNITVIVGRLCRG